MKRINEKNRERIRDITITAMLAAVMCVIAPWSVGGIIPFTLGTLALYLIAAIGGLKRGTAAILVYLAIGALGFPVFSAGRGGVGHFMTPGGGFLVGFVVAAVIIALFVRFGQRKGEFVEPASYLLGTLFGAIAMYATAVLWFVYITRFGGFALAWANLVMPFIWWELFKVVVGAGLAYSINTALNRRK